MMLPAAAAAAVEVPPPFQIQTKRQANLYEINKVLLRKAFKPFEMRILNRIKQKCI